MQPVSHRFFPSRRPFLTGISRNLADSAPAESPLLSLERSLATAFLLRRLIPVVRYLVLLVEPVGVVFLSSQKPFRGGSGPDVVWNEVSTVASPSHIRSRAQCGLQELRANSPEAAAHPRRAQNGKGPRYRSEPGAVGDAAEETRRQDLLAKPQWWHGHLLRPTALTVALERFVADTKGRGVAAAPAPFRCFRTPDKTPVHHRFSPATLPRRRAESGRRAG